MGHKINTSMVSKQLHAGLNSHIATYTLNETASASTTIAVMPIPAGAQITRAMVRADHTAINAGANAAAVRLFVTVDGVSIGDIINTATISYQVQSGVAGNTESGLGERLTGSANLILAIHDAVGTGTASTVFTVICDYLSELNGD